MNKLKLVSFKIDIASTQTRQKIWAHILMNEKLTDEMYIVTHDIPYGKIHIRLDKLKTGTLNCIIHFLNYEDVPIHIRY